MAATHRERKKGKTGRPGGPGPFGLTGQWLAYVVFRMIEAVLRVLPLEWCFLVGSFGGLIAFLAVPKYRRLARRNLEIAFGDEKSDAELRRLARDHFTTLGGNLLCSLKIPTLPLDAVRERVEIVGIENVHSATRHAKGFTYAIAHMGNWEILSQLPDICPQGKPGTLYQALGNPFINAHVARQRGRFGFRLFSRSDGFHAPVQFLRDGGGLGVLVDQHAGDGGVWCPLFGRLASTTNLAALLSLRTGCRVLPVGLHTTGRARWRIEVGTCVTLPEQDANALTAATNRELEIFIRQSPADWFWVHNRWKTPRPNFLLAQYKRGVSLPPGFMASQLKPFQIIVRAPNWLGDACMALPAVRALKRGRPDARVTVLTPAKLADFWRAVPDVDEVIDKDCHDGIFKVRRLVRNSGVRYEVAVLLTDSPRSALEVAGCGIPRIVGYRGRWRKWLVNQIVPERGPGPIEPHVRHFLRIAGHCGADIADRSIFAPLRTAAAPVADEPLTLGLCAGAEYGPAKRWPTERFAEAALAVSRETGASWTLFGAPADTALGERIASLMPDHCRNLTGRTTLVQLIEELPRCRLLLTNDTGTMHLAAALGVPVVAIFGSTEPAWTGPLGEGHTIIRHHVECSPCFLRECPLRQGRYRCLDEITAAEVAAAVIAKLAQAPSPA